MIKGVYRKKKEKFQFIQFSAIKKRLLPIFFQSISRTHKKLIINKITEITAHILYLNNKL